MEAFKIHAQKEELYDANIALMDQHTREPLAGESVCGGTDREKIVSEIPDGNAVVYCEGAFENPHPVITSIFFPVRSRKLNLSEWLSWAPIPRSVNGPLHG